jgi:hypothetical protein
VFCMATPEALHKISRGFHLYYLLFLAGLGGSAFRKHKTPNVLISLKLGM